MNRFGILNLIVAIGLIASVTAIDCNNRPDFKIAKDCCPHDYFKSKEIIESCNDYKKEGENSLGGEGPGVSDGGGRGEFHHNPCYAECVMNATEMVNLDTMSVDEAKTKSFLTKALSATPDFFQVVTDAIMKCAEKGKEIRAMRANDPPKSLPPGSCKPCAEMLVHCVKMEIIVNCPTSAWKNDETCNNLREFMMVCKPPQGGRPN